MLTEALFHTLPGRDAKAHATVNIEFNGTTLQVPADVSVAAALLAAGAQQFRRSAVGHEPRAPYCMMGVCFECLVQIDGVPSQQSCLITVREGMRVHTMEGARALEPNPSGERDGE